jgi:leucyl-tRNA synthetase
MGPLDKDKSWATNGIDGVRRFLDRVWRLVCNDQGQVIAADVDLPADLEKLLHKTIKKVSEDIEALNFNTAISAMMILVNEFYRAEIKPQKALLTLSQLLMPFAPHIAEEIWEKLGGEGFVSHAPWPQFSPELTRDDVVTTAVQVLGKTRGTIDISLDATEETAVKMAMEVTAVQTAVGDKKIEKVIYKPGKILNLIVR